MTFNGFFEIDVTVVPTAVIGPKSQTICSNNAFSVTPSNGGGDIVLAGTRYTWTVVDNSNVTGDVNETTPQLSVSQTLINTTIVPQTVVYTATSNSTNGCASTNFTVTIVVNPSPQIVNKTPTAICSGLSFSVLPVNGSNGDIVPASTNYTWTVSVNNNITGQSNNNSAQSSIAQTLTNISASVQTLTYTVTPTSPGSPGCTGSNFTITIDVNPKPSIGNKTPAAICSGSAFSVSPVSGSGELVPIGTTYSWVVSTNSNVTGQSNLNAQSSIGQTLTNLSNTNQILTYTVTPISSLGCEGASFTVSVTIKPGVTITNKNLPICSVTTFDGTPTNFTDIVPESTTYTWTVTSNSNITGASDVNALQGTVGQLLTNTSSIDEESSLPPKGASTDEAFNDAVIVSETLYSDISNAAEISSCVGILSKSCSNLPTTLFIFPNTPTWFSGILIILDFSERASSIDCLIHQTAYEINLNPLVSSNFLAAFIKPTLPSFIISIKGNP